MLYGSGKTTTEIFLLENAKFIVDQMASLQDKQALFESCKFLSQLKTRGQKHFEKVLKVKSKALAGGKEAREEKKVGLSDRWWTDGCLKY